MLVLKDLDRTVVLANEERTQSGLIIFGEPLDEGTVRPGEGLVWVLVVSR